mgnify:FL=1|jgi:hypothetical protein
MTPMVLSAIIGIESRFPDLMKRYYTMLVYDRRKRDPPENVDENLGEI